MSLLFLPLMFLVLYFLLIRPQQRKARAQQALQRAVEVGDEIITTSGLYGIITAMDDEDLWLEVAEGVEVRMARGAILRATQHGARDESGPEQTSDADAEAADEATVEPPPSESEPSHDERK